MSTQNKTISAAKKVRFCLLSLAALLILIVSVIYMNRERIVIKVTHHFSLNYGVKVEQLTGLVIKFDLQQPFFIESINLAKLDISVDYLQLQLQLQQQQATQVENHQSTSSQFSASSNSSLLSLPELPDWIPDLHITDIAVQAINLPNLATDLASSWSLLGINKLDVKNIKFNYNDAMPESVAELGFSVWLQGQQLLTSKFNLVTKMGGDKALNANLEVDLAKLNTFTDIVFPQLNNQVSGKLKLALSLNPQKIDSIGLRLLLSDAGLNYQQQQLLANLHLSLDSELLLADKAWQVQQVDLQLQNIEPITVSVDNCAQIDSLLKMNGKACQLFKQDRTTRLAPIILSPNLPLSLKLKLQQGDFSKWQISTKQLAMKAAMANNNLAITMTELQASPQHLQTNWAFSTVTNSRYFTDITLPIPIQVKAAGVIKSEQIDQSFTTEMLVNKAKITAQKLKHNDISSDAMRINLIAPIIMNTVDNKLQPFNFVIATTLLNNQYQQTHHVSKLTAQHQGQFSDSGLSVKSDWQLDDAILKTANTLNWLDFKPYEAFGYWLLPKQKIPRLITDHYPLPKELKLTANVVNRLDYQLELDLPSPVLTANLVGKLSADTASFNELVATDISVDWGCKMDASLVDLSESLNAKCSIYSDISSVELGPVINNINFSGLMSFSEQALQLRINNVSAEAFSGSIFISPLLITDFDHIVGQLHVRDLSLAKVLELYQVPGIKVTGLIKADFPFVMQGTALSITDGVVEQQGDGGIIQIKDNVTIDQLKLTQPQLSYALGLLENLHYEKLRSDVDYKPSGDTKLTINIKGRNPSVARPIEFNYSHEENILQLFRSLRINDSMYDALDKVNNL